MIKTILFACVRNAGRSQMAAAFFNSLADPRKAHAISAGTDPADSVHPDVVTVMKEAGIDLSSADTNRMTQEMARGAHMLVTMGCADQCPVIPGARYDDWPLDDPAAKSIEEVRIIRDDIRRRVEVLIEREAWS